MFWRFPIAIRHGGRLSRTQRSLTRFLLTDEEEVSEPVTCFCIQRRGLESSVVVGLRQEVTTAPAWAYGASTCSGLCDALLDAHEDKVGEDGRIAAFVEDCTDNGAGEIACERVLEEDLDLGD
jgi:hypothetical protein